MFHPTIFDNIRVVLEGAVYDRDFDGAILITGRSDRVDLADYHRHYQIDFVLAGMAEDVEAVKAQIHLRTTLADIAGEQLEQPQLAERIGSTIGIQLVIPIRDVERECGEIIALLHEIWGNRPHITLQIMARLDERHPVWPADRFEARITLDFQRKIDEGNIDDLRALIEHCILSVKQLELRRTRLNK